MVAALDLYLRTPFGRIHNRNLEIIALAGRIGRTPNAVTLKMANLAGLDETLARKGMANASKMDRHVWARFMESLRRIPEEADRAGQQGFGEAPPAPFNANGAREGIDVEILATRRSGQEVFRRMIIASYDERCALSEMTDKRLLIASHIVPWASDKSKRLDPTNGICLNPLLDRAFDTGLIAFGDDMRVLVAREAEDRLRSYLRERCTSTLRQPSRFRPDPQLFQSHRERWNREFAPIT